MFYPFHSGREVDSNNYKKVKKKKKNRGIHNKGKLQELEYTYLHAIMLYFIPRNIQDFKRHPLWK